MFLGYLYYQFDDRGGGVQRQLWSATLAGLGAPLEGSALDVGTGNGSIAVLLAAGNDDLCVTGVDLWSADWDYSMADCEANASRAGVGSRVRFQRASADALPFPDRSFDVVVSHFVFHEVESAADKVQVIGEALRVLKPGGAFAFHDMFLDASRYGDRDQLLRRVRSFGAGPLELIETRRLLKLPRALLGKRVLGHSALLHGSRQEGA